MLGADRVRGRFDRVDSTSGGVVITDYKSSDVPEQAVADRRARESLQLSIYALAHEAVSGAPPVRVQLRFLDSDTVGGAELTPARLDRARKTVARAGEGIRRGDFAPKPDLVACGFCPFRDICPASAA
jgi:DNA helicase-2/ATP-dependent DNA helicase PcrA